MKGHPVFDPNHNKPQPKLYRTNPSIPRPESKYGSKSTVYEQILELKKQNLDPNGLFKSQRLQKIFMINSN